MFVLGLQGSPRKKGNTAFLMSAFLREMHSLGARTHLLNVGDLAVEPCQEYTACETKGFCPIRDDMDRLVYPLLRRADIVVMGSPVFFYNVTAQLKAVIDRCQVLWARVHRLGLDDSNRSLRRGFILALGATKGKQLFTGIELTAKYFFDAIGAAPAGGLYYRGIEHRGDIHDFPGITEDIRRAAATLAAPFLHRMSLLFLCRDNARLSPMAAAFAQRMGGDRLDVLSAGTAPAEAGHPLALELMAEKGLDMAFRPPMGLAAAVEGWSPRVVVLMERGMAEPVLPGARFIHWGMKTVPEDREAWRATRDDIEGRVTDLLEHLEAEGRSDEA